MRFGLEEEVIAEINSVFAKYQNVEKVMLFGSRSKGTQKSDSDIDLTILGDNSDNIDLENIRNDLDALLLRYETDVSLFREIDSETLKAKILDRNVVFYEKKA
ncbi:MAG: nucleotidyltransferase domain-containing protein [Bacteroidales bacterium]|nr:nucleotidyltransferase domain-containing protein [Bacteroidales bacterium]